MKKFLKYLFFLIIGINLLIMLTGRDWMYKAISITYLKGYTSSYISDYIYFPSKTIENGQHQEWLVSSNYNEAKLPKFIKALNDSLETTAYMVIQKDSILFEKYWHGYSKDSLSNSFSISKSWISALIGIAIKDGKINSVEQKVCDFLPQFCGENEKTLTIKHLLTMSAGLNWTENYFNPIGKTAEAYYGRNLKDLVLNLKVVEEPGKTFKYNSCCTQLLAFILEKRTGVSINEYASEKLWKPLGAKHAATWSTDVKGGDEKAFCCINSNARDFARLGKLYLDYGSWNGIQLIDSAFIKESISSAELFDKKIDYGYQFWIAERNGFEIFYSRGLWGQYVICIPQIDMIVVRLGKKYGRLLNDGHHHDFYQFIDAALEMYN